ncbi:M24 family metallopeptidase [Dactylosporangium fulvum]|uniref:Aminopeptidase P family protein n=1 Tax=Dactylosporangium fulvum TaxID=53359 RepID=A0ABY5VRD7_9ACTN|nr:M24 family metallopeptidase [Dactylosporangium fulvum]UWP79860.1 aminopeptidase P family protein [Dactylosporangium fulvum]
MTAGHQIGEREAERQARLLAAEVQATELFAEVQARGLVAPGRRDREVSDAIRDLAHDMFGVEKFWHKRIVRSGPHTMEPYGANPPDRVIEADDVVMCDFGPIFDGWEADFGRTFVLGDDPVKHRLRDDLATIFAAGQRHFLDHPGITGEQLFTHVLGLIADAGWKHAAAHAGHLIGEFPHDRIDDDKISLYITHGSDQPMRRPDSSGRACHWILEVHIVDRQRGIGGFYEQLLDLEHASGTADQQA